MLVLHLLLLIYISYELAEPPPVLKPAKHSSGTFDIKTFSIESQVRFERFDEAIDRGETFRRRGEESIQVFV